MALKGIASLVSVLWWLSTSLAKSAKKAPPQTLWEGEGRGEGGRREREREREGGKEREMCRGASKR